MFKFTKGVRKKTTMGFLIMAGFILSGISVFASVMTMRNADTQKESDWSGETLFSDSLANEMMQITENENFILYCNPTTLAIQIKDKSTGVVHSSIAEDGDEVDGMNDSWRGMMQSGITLELLDSRGKIKTWPLSTKDASVELQKQKNGFRAKVTWPEGIGVTLEVVLTQDGIRVLLPEEGTWEEEDCKYTLQSIYVYPFLDANRGHGQNGYMFVPDGCGALIRTSAESLSSEPYEKRIYGEDIGVGGFTSRVETGMITEPENIHIPVYGMIQNVDQSGVAAIIESGDEYANIVAYASGVTTDFNFITAKFLVRQTYQMKINQSGASISANQEERNHFDIAVSYHFLSGEDANYVGIAECYRNYLLEQDVLEQVKGENKDIPLKLEFVVSEQKKSLVGTSTVSMTSVEEVDEILTDLISEGITNIDVVLRGVSKEGATAVSPTVFNFESTTGSKNEWKALAEKYKEKGIDIAFYCDFTRGYDGADGYSNGDRAQGIDKILLQTYDNGLFSYLSPTFTRQSLMEYAELVQDISVTNLAVDCFGTELYSNYNKNAKTTRTEAKKIFESINTGDVKLSLYSPNAYLWKLSNAMYDVPTDSGGYYIFTDTVPFLQIVLKGYKTMFGTGFNFHANTDTDMLKTMEYGVYPSYYLTQAETIDMLETASGWLYTSEYRMWKDSIISEYTSMNEVLKEVYGQSIIAREVLEDGVVKVTYSNGMDIIINYMDVAYETSAIEVEANSYLLIKDGVK